MVGIPKAAPSQYSWGRIVDPEKGEVVPSQQLPELEAGACQEGGMVVNQRGADSGSPCQGPLMQPCSLAEGEGFQAFPQTPLDKFISK